MNLENILTEDAYLTLKVLNVGIVCKDGSNATLFKGANKYSATIEEINAAALNEDQRWDSYDTPTKSVRMFLSTFDML